MSPIVKMYSSKLALKFSSSKFPCLPLNQALVGSVVLPHGFYSPVIGGVGPGTEGDQPFAIG